MTKTQYNCKVSTNEKIMWWTILYILLGIGFFYPSFFITPRTQDHLNVMRKMDKMTIHPNIEKAPIGAYVSVVSKGPLISGTTDRYSNIDLPGVNSRLDVEYCQWVESSHLTCVNKLYNSKSFWPRCLKYGTKYTYVRAWKKNQIQSDKFHNPKGHHNPIQETTRSKFN